MFAYLSHPGFGVYCCGRLLVLVVLQACHLTAIYTTPSRKTKEPQAPAKHNVQEAQQSKEGMLCVAEPVDVFTCSFVIWGWEG